MTKKFILFDFDGVIGDSFRPAFETQKKMCPHLTEEQYKKRFEGNINDWDRSKEKHSDQCQHDLDFFAEYVPRMKKEALVMPGMKEVVAELANTHTLIIISSTLTSPIEFFLKKFGMKDYFVEVMGNDVHGSKVEKTKMVFEKYGVGGKDCVFITDTLGDLREAEKSGVDSIGVTWGFHSAETLERGNPWRVVDSPEDLIKAISEY